MYSINVFVTFSLAQLGMCRFWVRERHTQAKWKRAFAVHAVGLALCSSILALVIIEKFDSGGWVTLLVTAALIWPCFLVRGHYRSVQKTLEGVGKLLELPAEARVEGPGGDPDRSKPTAVLLVNRYGAVGLHSLLTIFRLFPGVFRQVVFMSVGVINSENFKGEGEVERLRARTQKVLDQYVAAARGYGLAATGAIAVGTEVVSEAEDLCLQIAKDYPKAMFFAGKLMFEREKWYHRFLHNETAFAIERRLQWRGLPVVILPVRVWKPM
jgi:K+ transporter